MSSTPPDSLQSTQHDVADSEKDEMDPIEVPRDPEKATITPPNALTGSDWTGPDDRDNPQNWSAWIRLYHIIPPALISFAA
jgi:hypothetical protein